MPRSVPASVLPPAPHAAAPPLPPRNKLLYAVCSPRRGPKLPSFKDDAASTRQPRVNRCHSFTNSVSSVGWAVVKGPINGLGATVLAVKDAASKVVKYAWGETETQAETTTPSLDSSGKPKEPEQPKRIQPPLYKSALKFGAQNADTLVVLVSAAAIPFGASPAYFSQAIQASSALRLAQLFFTTTPEEGQDFSDALAARFNGQSGAGTGIALISGEGVKSLGQLGSALPVVGAFAKPVSSGIDIGLRALAIVYAIKDVKRSSEEGQTGRSLKGNLIVVGQLTHLASRVLPSVKILSDASTVFTKQNFGMSMVDLSGHTYISMRTSDPLATHKLKAAWDNNLVSAVSGYHVGHALLGTFLDAPKSDDDVADLTKPERRVLTEEDTTRICGCDDLDACDAENLVNIAKSRNINIETNFALT